MSPCAEIGVGFFRSPTAFGGPSMNRYADGLAAALSELDGAPLVTHVAPDDSRIARGALRRRHLRRPASHVVRFPAYMAHARGRRFDVNHVLDHGYGQLAFVLDPRRTVVTCHDLFPLKLWRGEIDGLPRRRVPPLTVRLSVAGMLRAAALIVPSEATKRDVVGAGYPAERVFVVRHGVEAKFRPHSPEELDAYPLGGPATRHILSVDTGVPYKNPRASVEVLARVASASAADVRLVRVGSRLPQAERARAESYGVADRIIDLGVVPEADLPRLYSRCDVLLFPSLYEGFGWPVLEAMACGTPVVRSTWASLGEIAGDAALAAGATDYDSLAAHVLAVLDDEALAHDLARRGCERAATFTWRRAAEQTLAVYTTLCELPRPVPAPAARVVV